MAKRLAADNGRWQCRAKAVAYGSGVSGSTEKWLCQFPGNDLVVLLDIALHYFISRIK